MLSLYAKKEPTADPVTLQYGPKGKLDTVLYRDRACTQAVARWPWHHSNCPRKNQTRVTFNCYRWDLIWCK